jgi:hypothetical protein
MKSLLFFFSEMKSSLFFFLNEFIIFLLVFARKAMNTSGEMKSFSFHEHPVTELARRQPPHQQSITRQHGTRRQPSSYRTRSDGTLPSTSAATAARCSAVRFDSVASKQPGSTNGIRFSLPLKTKTPQAPASPIRAAAAAPGEDATTHQRAREETDRGTCVRAPASLRPRDPRTG